MKRKITCILACVLVITTIIPSMALAASNATILEKLTLNGVKVYDVAPPTNGTKKTEKQINELLKKIPNKPLGKGNTTYSYSLSFGRPTANKPGNYEWAYVSKLWYKNNDKTKTLFNYFEERDLKNTKEGIRCHINKFDPKNGNSYTWIKGKKTGEHNTWKITTSNINDDPMKPLNFKLYPDAAILGEKCMVYSCEYKSSDGTVTYYNFVSRNTRQNVKYIYSDPNFIYASIDFEHKLVDKADSFFDPPKDVKFITN